MLSATGRTPARVSGEWVRVVLFRGWAWQGSGPSGRSVHGPERPCVPLRLVVLGMMGRCPFGGQTWLYLNWLRGLSALGHDVWYVEDDSVWPYDPTRDTVSAD